MPRVEVRSKVIGAGIGPGLPSVFFDAGSERLTVRTILLRAVDEQVRDLNARRELSRIEAQRYLARQYQTEEEILRLRESGQPPLELRKVDSQRPHIELATAQSQALNAFTSGRCLVYVDGQQMDGLDQEVQLKGNSEVQFVRLLPLRGGSSIGS